MISSIYTVNCFYKRAVCSFCPASLRNKGKVNKTIVTKESKDKLRREMSQGQEREGKIGDGGGI